MKKVFLSIFALLIIGFVFAHQPRIIFKQPVWQIVNVEQPEISQAFYSMLSGQEDVYQIVSDTGFLLYVNIVVPDLPGQRTDFIIDINESDEIVTTLEGTSFVWTDFFEKFWWDAYLQWPSYEKEVGPWTYTIKISNSENQWKYSLAIGKIERFDFKEILNTYKVMPMLKMQFFEKPWYMTFWSLVGVFLGWAIVIVIVSVRWIYRFLRYIRNKHL